MNDSKRKYLCNINDSKFMSTLENALDNGNLFIALASGKINDLSLIRKLYAIEESVLENDKYNVDVHENYFDDGVNFSATVSFIKKKN